MTRHHARVGAVGAALGLALLVGCDDDLPDAVEQEISGTVSYAGPAEFANPVAQVIVSASFPPVGQPHGVAVLEAPDFAAGPVPFSIPGIPAHSYFVVASYADAQDLTNQTNPTGAFPNFCVVLAPVAGPVTVGVDEAIANIDITLYDGGGTTDPCFAMLPTSAP